jgi:outer membrane cobalamin receptor
MGNTKIRNSNTKAKINRMKFRLSKLYIAKLLVLTYLLLPGKSDAQIIYLPDTVKIEEVVVTGSRVEVSRRNVPLTVSTVERSQIERSNESALFPVLSRRIPGLFVTERGVTGFGVGTGSAGQVSMRGVGGSAPNTQVLVLIDGHPQFQGLFGHPLPDAYVSSDVEKVEVIRGPASILYGSNAMGGVINIITREQQEEGFSGKARLSYGSFNTQKYMVSGGLKEGPFSVFASLNHDRTEGHRDTSEFKIVNGYVKAGYELNENFDISADVSIADFNAQDPGTVFNPMFFGIDILRGKTSLSVKNHFERVEGGLLAFYNFGDHSFTNGWESKDRHTGISLYQGLRLFPGNRLTLGIDYKSVSGIANDGAPGAADVWHSVSDYAGYAYVQQTFADKLIVSAGLRAENNSMFGFETIPQVGLSFLASENTTVKGSWSKGFRNPTLMELYLFAPNQELEPERITNYELGMSQTNAGRTFRVELAVFALEATNVIEVRPNDAPPPPVKRQNVGAFSNKGIELELSWQATANLGFSSNYSYLSLDKPRLAAPEHQFYAEGNYAFGDFRATLSVQQISGLYTLTTGQSPEMESYTLANMMLSYTLNENFELFASGKNLLDQEYSINYGYPMPGATVFAGVNIGF